MYRPMHHALSSRQIALGLLENLDSLISHTEYPAVSVIAKLSPDTAVETSPIPTRATASTGDSKPRLYCHRCTQYIVHLCRRRHSCQRGTNTIALLCLLCLLRISSYSSVVKNGDSKMPQVFQLIQCICEDNS
jgi:hypothetical protein